MSQSYIPPNDVRYRRERTPPPRAADRYEVPRGPRAFESQRGPGQFAPRGRGGFAPRGDYRGERGDYRGDFRERDLIRDNRDPSPPGRSWRDRDFRERRPSPPGRPAPGQFRDFRDAPPRELDIGRGRRDSRDGSFTGPPQFSTFRDSAPPGRGRGAFIRGRGRAEWDGRGRGREFPDDRDTFRPRSRSPPRDDHWVRDSSRDNREFDRRDEYRPVRRESNERLDRDRDSDRFRRDAFPSGNESRRTSAPSTRPTTPHAGPPPSAHTFTQSRQVQDQDRDANSLRRVSSLNNPPPNIRDTRPENFKPDLLASRVEASRRRLASGASSPLQAPQVPAFGSFAPPKDAAPWNVWRAPTEPKSQQAPVGSIVPAPTQSIVKPQPVGPKHEAEAGQQANLKVESDRVTPPANKLVNEQPAIVVPKEVAKITLSDAPKNDVRAPTSMPKSELGRVSPLPVSVDVEMSDATGPSIDPTPTLSGNRSAHERSTPLPIPKPETERLPPSAPRVELERIPPPAARVEAERLPPPAPRPEAERLPPPAPRPEAERLPPPAPRPEAERLPPQAPRAEAERLPPKAPKADRVQEHIPFAPRGANYANNAPSRSMETSISPKPHPTPTIAVTQPLVKDLPDPPRRSSIELLRSPPTQPRQQTFYPPAAQANNRQESSTFVPKGPGPLSITSPVISPHLGAPLGPRGPISFGSPTSLGNNVPKGPKADRLQPPPPQAPLRAPTGPSAGLGRPWNRPGPPMQPFKPGTLIPTKRNSHGEEKEKISVQSQTDVAMKMVDKRSLSPSQPAMATAQSLSTTVTNDGGISKSDTAKSSSATVSDPMDLDKVDVAQTKAEQSPPILPKQLLERFVDEDDGMDLDAVDFEENEAKFESQKAELESQLIDLSTRHLRGATPLETLAYLGRMAIDDIRLPNLDATQPQLMTPKAEDSEPTIEMEAQTPPHPGTPPIGSPELRALPYLCHEPITPLSELDIFQENLARHEANREIVAAELDRRLRRRNREEDERREEYASVYKPWKRHTDELDKSREDEKTEPPSVVQAASIAVADAAVAVATTVEGRRGRGGNNTEYDLQKVLQESMLTASLESINREKEALGSKPDFEREAVIPEMLSESAQVARAFRDTSQRKAPELAIRIFELLPPKDDFTPEEHHILVESYKETPKQFGFIARDLPGRSYKECINHYYATKWNKEYKPPKDKRKTKRRLKNGLPVPNRSKANALISNRTDVYDADEFGVAIVPVTDSGRPKRAAAPTFGEKDTDDSTGQTTGRKGARGDVAVETNAEKPGRKPRVATKEKVQRRTRAPTTTRTLSTSPEKMDVDMKRPPVEITSEHVLAAGELDAVSSLAAMQSGQLYNLSMESTQPLMSDYSNQALGGNGALDIQKYGQHSKPGVQASSYWSKLEERGFPHLLSHFGTDWQAIAQEMGTKTQTMVKNYYNRLLLNGRSDLEEFANQADQKRQRGEKIGPPPTPNMAPKRRNDQMQTSVPRAIAPSKDFVEAAEGSPQVAVRNLDQPLAKQQYKPTSFSPATSAAPLPMRTNSTGRSQLSETSLAAPVVEMPSQPGPVRLSASHEYRTEPRPSSTPFLQAVPLPPRSIQVEQVQRPEMVHERSESRDPPPATFERSWHSQSRPDAPRPSMMDRHAMSQPLTKPHYGSPQQQFIRPPLEPAVGRSILDERMDPGRRMMLQEAMAEPSQPHYPGEHESQKMQPSLSGFNNSVQPSPVTSIQEEKRAPPVLPSSSAPALAVPKQEPRRTSNLMSILNDYTDEPKEPRRPQPKVESARTAATPQPAYPALAPPTKPVAQPERRDPYHSGYPNPSYGPVHSSVHTRHEMDSREAVPYASGRQDWPPRPTYTSLPPSTPSGPAYSMEKPAESHPHYPHHRPSLSTMSSRNNASPPPPLYGYGPSRDQTPSSQHQPPPPPPLQYQGLQQTHHSPLNSLHPNPYGAPPAVSRLSVHPNQQIHSHNNSISAYVPPHQQQQQPQRQTPDTGMLRQEHTGYRPRQQQQADPHLHQQLSREEQPPYLPRDRIPNPTAVPASSRPSQPTNTSYAQPSRQPRDEAPPPPPPPPQSRQDHSQQHRHYRAYSSPREEDRPPFPQHMQQHSQQESRFGTSSARGLQYEALGPRSSSSSGIGAQPLSLAELSQRGSGGGISHSGGGAGSSLRRSETANANANANPSGLVGLGLMTGGTPGSSALGRVPPQAPKGLGGMEDRGGGRL